MNPSEPNMAGTNIKKPTTPTISVGTSLMTKTLRSPHGSLETICHRVFALYPALKFW